MTHSHNAALADLITLAEAVVVEHENLDDRAPSDPDCIECNLGTGRHRRTCAYHFAKSALRKIRAPIARPA